MKKKKSKKSKVLCGIGILVALGIYALYKSSKENDSSPTSSEGGIYDEL